LINKKQVATWIVTGVLVAGAGAALAEGGTEDPSLGTTSETTLVDETTTTTVADETTTTTEAVDATTTTTAGTEGESADVAVDGEDGPGNSVAAQNHECDEAWGNHGAWVSANAHAKKTGAEVSCGGPGDAAVTTQTTDTTVAADGTADTQDVADGTADDVDDTAAVTTSSPTHGKGHAKKK
jgi:hypothetical protein